jgi:ADP-L-glycero-D-manno-heptose 6-epimerase
MIVVTGAAGFIGSCLTQRLNELGFNDLLLVDDFSIAAKEPNLAGKKYHLKIHRDDFPEWMENNPGSVNFIFHIGARTDTTEFDTEIFEKLNVSYSKKIWELATKQNVPLVYASSAATYGEGEFRYEDRHDLISELQQLNPYGWSKQFFDLWALEQTETPPQWQGLKFFNVYGPNEYHKGRMASVIFHAFNQINGSGKVKLFRSHRNDFKDGWQLRDFIYVKDVVAVCIYLMQNKVNSAIYNLGTGKARSFYDLAASTFHAMGKDVAIEYVDIPADIRDKYQYFTEANMHKLINTGYHQPFYSLEDGIKDYVSNYLVNHSSY